MRPLLACLLLAGLSIDPAGASTGPSVAVPRQFIIGMSGRWQSPGDRRQPRRWYQADSSLGAYVDVEQLDDPTWLADELAAYATRAADCEDLGSAWCRRELRARDDAVVLFLAAGVHAEVVWISGTRAVRLGWRRVVETPTGTLTLDEPPAEFAARVFTELPTTLRAEAAGDARAAEVDRLLYYVDRALTAPCATAEQRRAVERFVARNLARIAALTGVDDEAAIGPTAGQAQLSDRLAMLRAWRAATHPLMTDACEWCRAWAP